MKEFLEKRWWQGVGGIAGIIALVLVVLQFLGIVNISWLGFSIAINIIFGMALALVVIWAIKWKHRYVDVNGRLEKIKEIMEKQPRTMKVKRVLLPDPKYIWKLNIDNALLMDMYGEAHANAITDFHDARLADLDIIVYPYAPRDRVSILFGFYSRWADRVCTYIITESIDMHQSVPSEPATDDSDRVTFSELPWIRDSDWSQFLRKSCEKVGPISPARWTLYHLSTRAWREPLWSIDFKDGVTGREFKCSWVGEGEPVIEE